MRYCTQYIRYTINRRNFIQYASGTEYNIQGTAHNIYKAMNTIYTMYFTQYIPGTAHRLCHVLHTIYTR